MTSKLNLSLLFATALALGLAGCAPPNSEAGKEAQSATTEVRRGVLTSDVIESGTLDARKTVEVKSRVGGRVARLLVDEGDQVRAGQLVAVIDPQETELQVEQTAAQLRGAQSAVDRSSVEIAQRRITVRTSLARARSRVQQLELEVRAQPSLVSASINSARASLESAQRDLTLLSTVTQPNQKVQVQRDVEDAEASLTRARAELRRRDALLSQGYLAAREVEVARLDVVQAESRTVNTRERLNRLEREHELARQAQQKRIEQLQIEVERAQTNSISDPLKRRELEQARQSVIDAEAALRDVDALIESQKQQKASVDQISSQLQDGQRQLGETEIRAPVSGIVTRRFVQEGELVNALSSFSPGTAIMRIEDRSAMKVKLEINEIDIAQLQLGTPVQVRVDAFPGESLQGEVTKISPASTFTLQQDVNAAGSSDQVIKYAVEVTLSGADARLRSGMSAEVTITTFRKEGALQVRSEFIGGKAGERRFVLKITGEPEKEGEKPPTEEQTVEIGASAGPFTEILKGVQQGDKLLRPDSEFPDRKGLMQFGGGGQGGEDEEGGEDGGGQGG